MRIPTRFHFPFGYTVRIKLVTKSEMEEEGGDGCDGLWLSDQKLILILKRLPSWRRRWVTVHELGHAWLDYQHWLENKGLFNQTNIARKVA